MRLRLKRLGDVVGAVLLLLAAMPLLAIASLAILLEDGRPVLFRQVRVGKAGRHFLLLKLRSMKLHVMPVQQMGQVRQDHCLVLRCGQWLRRLKIDELPQLLNVISGDMSLVGPRPTVPEQVREYSSYEQRRLETTPGLTGWAQIHGNIELTWAERIALDVWYVDHWSLGLDVKILLMTLGVVIRGERRNEDALREAAEHAKCINRNRRLHGRGS